MGTLFGRCKPRVARVRRKGRQRKRTAGPWGTPCPGQLREGLRRNTAGGRHVHLESGTSLGGLLRGTVPGRGLGRGEKRGFFCPFFLPCPLGKLISLPSGLCHQPSRGCLGVQFSPSTCIKASHLQLLMGGNSVCWGADQKRAEMRWPEESGEVPQSLRSQTLSIELSFT